MKKSEAPKDKKGLVNAAEIEFPYTYSKPGCSITVRIYKTPTRGYDAFTVVYYQDGVRNRPTFPSFEKAVAKADEVTRLLGTQNLNLIQLSSADSESYKRARAILDPLGLTVDFVASQYAYCVNQLGPVPPAVAIDDYRKRHQVKLEVRSVAETVDDMLKAKTADGASERYLENLRYCLRKFQDTFQTDIGEVRGPEIDSWLRGSGLAPRTRNNIRTAIHTLFKFARGMRYLHKDHDELDSVAVVNDRDGDIEVFTPAEMIEILSCASDRMHSFLAIGAFAGIRHAEIQRLEWRDIHFDEGIIEIQASKAKTASRRLVPITDNLREWLVKHRQPSGEVAWHRNVAFEMHGIAKRANQARRAAWAKANGVSEEQLKGNEERAQRATAKSVERGALRRHKGEVPPGAETAEIEGWEPFAWKHNALRHSFISYRVAEIQNIPQVTMALRQIDPPLFS